MKIIDALLILIILAIGGGYYYQRNLQGNCNNGQITLTNEVKAAIDAEFLKAQGRGQEIAGLKDLMVRTTNVEKQWAELQTLRAQYREGFALKYRAIGDVLGRKKAFDAELTKYIEELKNKVMNACLKSKPAKKI